MEITITDPLSLRLLFYLLFWHSKYPDIYAYFKFAYAKSVDSKKSKKNSPPDFILGTLLHGLWTRSSPPDYKLGTVHQIIN